MKIRLGFVSNSSSSSFIVAEKPQKVCNHCGRSDPSFLGMVHTLSSANDDTQILAEGQKLIDILERSLAHKRKSFDYFEWMDEGDIKVLLEKVTERHQLGLRVAYVALSNHDRSEQTLDDMTVAGTVEILRDFK